MGDRWLSGSQSYASIQMPSVTLDATSELHNPNAIDVSWASPGNMAFTVYVVTQDSVRRVLTTTQGNGSLTFHGKPGRRDWLWANATSNPGRTHAAGAQAAHVARLNHGGTSNYTQAAA